MSKAFIAGLLSLTLFAVLAAETRLDGIAAVVGDEVILQSEIEAYCLLRISNLGLNKDSVDLDSYRKKFLDELIDGKVLLVHAKNDSTISVTDQEVENAVNNHISMLLKQNNLTLDSLDAVLRKEQNITLAKFKSEARKALREQLLKQKVHQAYLYSIKVNRKDVEQFYNQYKDSLPSAGESVLLSKISMKVNPRDSVRQAAFTKIKSIKQRLDNGADFAEMAKQFSESPEGIDGGDLGFISKGSLNELTFEEKAFSLPAGQISEPFETRLGFHILNVLGKRDQKVHLRQIFIRVAPTEQQILSVTSKLDSIRANCKSSEQFIAAVKKFSDDPASKSQNGKLGWMPLLELPAAVRTAIDSSGTGFITMPVKEDNSYAIYRVDDRTSNRKLTLEHDYLILAEKTRDILAQKKLISLVSEWRKKIFVDIRI
ncbi:MAG TPA: peptidylprolyl isomerase [Chitinispirillaceae bacterium]|jgi:peptidyl-prolyl cis-trans isomerase SurA|nr:peptidylprolyl isomerase [Chitinispirillaceae bacterium]